MFYIEHGETVKGEADVWVDQRTVNCIFRLIAFDYVLYGKKYSILTSFVKYGIFFSFINAIINYKLQCFMREMDGLFCYER